MATIDGAPFLVDRAVIPGGPAGLHRVGGMPADATLLSVIRTGVAGARVADLTVQFAVAGAGALDNTGGTVTTGDWLAVVWSQPG